MTGAPSEPDMTEGTRAIHGIAKDPPAAREGGRQGRGLEALVLVASLLRSRCSRSEQRAMAL